MPTPPSTEPPPSSSVGAGDVREGQRGDVEEGRRGDVEEGQKRAEPDGIGGPDALGCEWIVEARGCTPDGLADLPLLKALFRRIVDDLELHEVRPSVWHVFPGHGGITGMSLLAESHLTCHTFPEHGTACLNLFCCRPRPEWDFEAGLREVLGAEEVEVRRLRRRFAPALAHAE